MTRVVAALADRWPRCPDCGAVAYPGWATDHRRGCAFTHVNPDEWSKP